MKTLKELWFYIIQTDDGDRYLREVYANDELAYIAGSREAAEEKFNELLALTNLNNED